MAYDYRLGEVINFGKYKTKSCSIETVANSIETVEVVSILPPLPIKKIHKHRSIPLPDNWESIRQWVIDRDKICQDCHGSGHSVHHKDRDRTHNNPSNLVYLCWPCHRKRHNANLHDGKTLHF